MIGDHGKLRKYFRVKAHNGGVEITWINYTYTETELYTSPYRIPLCI